MCSLPFKGCFTGAIFSIRQSSTPGALPAPSKAGSTVDDEAILCVFMCMFCRLPVSGNRSGGPSLLAYRYSADDEATTAARVNRSIDIDIDRTGRTSIDPALRTYVGIEVQAEMGLRCAPVVTVVLWGDGLIEEQCRALLLQQVLVFKAGPGPATSAQAESASPRSMAVLRWLKASWRGLIGQPKPSASSGVVGYRFFG